MYNYINAQRTIVYRLNDLQATYVIDIVTHRHHAIVFLTKKLILR